MIEASQALRYTLCEEEIHASSLFFKSAIEEATTEDVSPHTEREKLGSRLKSDSIGNRMSADSVVIFGGTEEKEKESKSSGDCSGCNWNLVPYNGTKYFLHWPSVLSQEFPYDHNSLEVFCESDGWIGKIWT